MNRIKIISILITVLMILTACAKDDYSINSRNLDPFLRFNFLVNSNNTPLKYPQVNTTFIPVSSYENKSVQTLKIPVTLSATTLKKPVMASFSMATTGDATNFNVHPVNELSFEGNQLTDTIFVSFEKRWETNQHISFKLETVSDPLVQIGNLNSDSINDTFNVMLAEATTTYSFPTNRIEISGTAGEKIDFKVNFPYGFIPSEIKNTRIFKFLDGFSYSLTHDDYGDNRSSITYHLTLLEDIKKDDVYYQTTITLVNTDNYRAVGNAILQIVKPIKSIRDIAVNTASNFYDLSNRFHLTYGENWFDRNGVCEWRGYSAFTFPVTVTKDSENAVLHSDNGSSNPADDVYYDAFKIGFNIVNGSNTTNSFNLKRWFSNESNSAADSPGFNIESAIEFFPENGNSKTKGSVLIIPQFITIAGRTGNSYSIAIAGSGTYKEISDGLFEISFELKATSQALFGGTVTSQYKLYNNRRYPDPAPLANGCRTPIDL
jgi:hypothetical protein